MRYWMSPDDDDFGFFDDDSDDQFDDQTDDGEEYEEEEPEEDDSYDEQEEDEFDSDDEQDGEDGDDQGADTGGDGDYDDEGLIEDDPEVFADAEDFPDADEEDFEDDTGDWTPDDYQESANNLFGRHPFFGDTIFSQREAEGFQHFDDPQFRSGFDSVVPGASEGLHLFERGGRLVAFGFLTQMALSMLMSRYTGIDWTNIETTVPQYGEPIKPQPLPPEFANVKERDVVDLRKFCTPIGDQRQTSRCSAFAWTHGVELSRNILAQPAPRLSPNYTMYQFQKMQGDAKDYQYAYKGGEGTISGTEPGEVIAHNGTCKQDLWPDDQPTPMARDNVLTEDARNWRVEGAPWPIAIDDVKKVLSAGCPVHVSMNTGATFSEVGRDGLFNAAEAPSGQHGRHAMLIVGYTGNFYIVKNSWGTEWGDLGYCYIPKNVLAASEPEFVAMLLKGRANQQ